MKHSLKYNVLMIIEEDVDKYMNIILKSLFQAINLY